MTKKTKIRETKIPLKNYIYSILILGGGILLTFYIFSWINVKKEEEIMNSYLVKTKTVTSSIKNLEDLSQMMQEMPSSYFIYLSYTNDFSTYNLEKEMKRVIDEYNLNDVFYYFDVTDMLDNKDYINEINEKLNVNLERTPAIIYVTNGEILKSNVLDGEGNTTLKVDDFKKMLEIYEFEKTK